VSRISKVFRKKKRYHFAKTHNILRYSILTATAILFIFGNIFLLSLIDPYSIFGRITADFIRPLFIVINNTISGILEKREIYSVVPVRLIHFDYRSILPTIAITSLILWFSAKYGRLFCNTICPVGTLLGALSTISFLKIKINKTTCNRCGKCANVCKAQCIDIAKKEVDFSRCVACYNCIDACSDNSINYTPVVKKKKAHNATSSTDESKREFIASILVYVAGFAGLKTFAQRKRHRKRKHQGRELIKVGSEVPVTPPGSLSLDHFTSNCTACHLCVQPVLPRYCNLLFLNTGWLA
jgi:ferredoxin